MPPLVPGTNCITIAEDALVETLAQTQAFQAFVGAEDVEGARSKIYVHDVPMTTEDRDDWTLTEWQAIYPCAIIGPPPDGNILQMRYTANSVLYDMTADLRFLVRFERLLPANVGSTQDEIRDLINAIGDILDGLAASAGAEGTFGFTSLTTNGVPYRSNFGRGEPMGVIQGWEIQVERQIQEGGQ